MGSSFHKNAKVNNICVTKNNNNKNHNAVIIKLFSVEKRV